MPAKLFWFNDTQWAAIVPLLPVNQRGPKRIQDRLVMSGIVHSLRTGCAWRACPASYGPYMTVFNRYNRWKKRGIWQKIVAVLPDDLRAELGPAEIAPDTPRAPRISRWRPEAVCLAGVMQDKSAR